MQFLARRTLVALLMAVGCSFGAFAQSPSPVDPLPDEMRRIHALENDVQRLNVHAPVVALAVLVFFLFGGVCALWAQNSSRSTFVWFFLGFIFNIFALIWMLKINGEDMHARRERSRLRRNSRTRETMSRPQAPFTPSERARTES